jgi:two-component system response regulator RpfG
MKMPGIGGGLLVAQGDMPPSSLGQTVMVLDDQGTGRLILAEILKGLDRSIKILMYSDPREAIAYARASSVDLIVTDYKMPTMDGVETIRRLREIYPLECLPIIMVTIVNEGDIRSRAFDAGATDFLTRPLDPAECRARFRNLLNWRRQQVNTDSRIRSLDKRVENATRELRLRQVDIILRLMRVVHHYDAPTEAHLKRVGKYSALLARQMDFPADQVECIELAATMHDIGKIGIPECILKKTGQLNADEAAILQKHVHIGYDLLKGSSSFLMEMAAMVALNHHEKFDGTGYPSGLQGTHIPLPARIVALADMFDKLTDARFGAPAWTHRRALDFIATEKGKYFDPDLVELFVKAQIDSANGVQSTEANVHGSDG